MDAYAVGQINDDSKFGQALVKLCKDPSNKIFIDVGTWNGLGTTKLLVDNTKGHIISIEANADWYQVAVNNYRIKPSNLTLLYGKLSNKMMTNDEVESHNLFNSVKDHYKLHYAQDRIDFSKAKIVDIPWCPDVVILDGGEFSGIGDFEAVLAKSPKIIALDDTKVIKNFKANEFLKAMRWTLVSEGSERNGWAIWKRM